MPMDEKKLMELVENMASAKAEHNAFNRRLDEHDKKLEDLYDLSLAIQKQGTTLEAVGKTLTSLKTSVDAVAMRVSAIEKEPADNAKKIVFEIIKYVLLAAAGAAIGYLFK